MKLYKKFLLVLLVSLSIISIFNFGCSMSKYNVKVTNYNTDAGVVSGTGEYRHGEKVEISAESIDETIYAWKGWYLNGKCYTTDRKFTYIAQKRDVEFVAEWSDKLVTIVCYSNLNNDYTNINDSNVLMRYEAENVVENNSKRNFLVVTDKNTIEECKTEMETKNNCIIKTSAMPSIMLEYEFLGWYTDKELTNVFCGKDGVVEKFTWDTTQCVLYAKWKLKTSTLKIKSNSVMVEYKITSSSKILTGKGTTYQTDEIKKNDVVTIEITNKSISSGQIQNVNNDIWHSETSLTPSKNGMSVSFNMDQNVDIELVFDFVDDMFEYDVTDANVENKGCVLVNCFGNQKIADVPYTCKYKIDNVECESKIYKIANTAFQNSSCEQIIINRNITDIESGTFVGDKVYNIYFNEGYSKDIYTTLINKTNFSMSDNIYLDMNTVYDNGNNNTLIIDDKVKELIDGICAIFDGTIVTNKFTNTTEFCTMAKYMYMHNIVLGDYEFGLSSKVDQATAETIRNIVYNQIRNFADFYNEHKSSITLTGAGDFIEYTSDSKFKIKFIKLTNVVGITREDLVDMDFKLDDMYKNISITSLSFKDGLHTPSIENVAKKMVCTTSDEMLYAIENGYKPEFLDNQESNEIKMIYTRLINALKMLISDNMTDMEKITIIHDYIIENTEQDKTKYDSIIENNPSTFSGLHNFRSNYLEGAVIDGICTDSTLQKYLSIMLSMEGIVNEREPMIYTNSTILDGTGKPKEMRNIINRVKFNNKWYNVRINFSNNDNISSDKTAYFKSMTHRNLLVTDEELTYTNGEAINRYSVEDENKKSIDSIMYENIQNTKFKYGSSSFDLHFKFDSDNKLIGNYSNFSSTITTYVTNRNNTIDAMSSEFSNCFKGLKRSIVVGDSYKYAIEITSDKLITAENQGTMLEDLRATTLIRSDEYEYSYDTGNGLSTKTLYFYILVF